MPDYALGKIYRIISPNTDRIYIGSTCEPRLTRRLSSHVVQYKRWVAGTSYHTSSSVIIAAGDYNIELIELYPCSHHADLRVREQHHIRENAGTVCNANRAYADDDETKEMLSRYRAAHADEINRRSALYRAANPDRCRRHAAEYAAAHPQRRRKHITCECGGRYTLEHKQVHLRSGKHTRYVRDIVSEIYPDEDWSEVSLNDMHEVLEIHALISNRSGVSPRGP